MEGLRWGTEWRGGMGMVVVDVGGSYFSGLRRCLTAVAVDDGLCNLSGEWLG